MKIEDVEELSHEFRRRAYDFERRAHEYGAQARELSEIAAEIVHRVNKIQSEQKSRRPVATLRADTSPTVAKQPPVSAPNKPGRLRVTSARKDTMSKNVMFINASGGGFAGDVSTKATTLGEFLNQNLGDEFKPRDYLVRINGERASSESPIQDGDMVSVILSGIEGRCDRKSRLLDAIARCHTIAGGAEGDFDSAEDLRRIRGERFAEIG